MKLIVPNSIKDIKISSIAKKYSEKLTIIVNAILEINKNNKVTYTKLENRLRHCYNDIAIYISSMVGIPVTYNYNRQEFKFTLKNGTDATCQFRIKEDYKWGEKDADGKTIINYVADFDYSHCSAYNTSEYFYLCYQMLRLVENNELLIINAVEAFTNVKINVNEISDKIFDLEKEKTTITNALSTMIGFEKDFRSNTNNEIYISQFYNVSNENIIEHCQQLISEMNNTTTFGIFWNGIKNVANQKNGKMSHNVLKSMLQKLFTGIWKIMWSKCYSP